MEALKFKQVLVKQVLDLTFKWMYKNGVKMYYACNPETGLGPFLDLTKKEFISWMFRGKLPKGRTKNGN